MEKKELGEIILSSEQQLYATSKSILKNDQDCADAIQETIVKAFANIKNLKKDCYAKTWLMRILINECYNLLRKEKRNMLYDTEYAEQFVREKPRDYSELYRAVDALKDELRVPVILYYMEGFSVKEIANILKISEGAVQKRLARARNLLRNSINLEEVFA